MTPPVKQSVFPVSFPPAPMLTLDSDFNSSKPSTWGRANANIGMKSQIILEKYRLDFLASYTSNTAKASRGNKHWR